MDTTRDLPHQKLTLANTLVKLMIAKIKMNHHSNIIHIDPNNTKKKKKFKPSGFQTVQSKGISKIKTIDQGTKPLMTRVFHICMVQND